MCRVMGTRQSFSTTDIQKREKSSRTARRAVSEMKLFSREYYAYKLDSMEDEDIFSSACTSRLHEHFKLCKATQCLDRARSRNKHIQLRYIRNRIQDLFQDVVKFSAAHQEYMNQVRNRNSSNENIDSSKLDEDREFYVATGGSEPYVVECKEGLDIADVEHCCGDYVTNFNRILRVYQWLYRCKRSNNWTFDWLQKKFSRNKFFLYILFIRIYVSPINVPLTKYRLPNLSTL